jgi:uncharacterized protein (TIGR02099 family)
LALTAVPARSFPDRRAPRASASLLRRLLKMTGWLAAALGCCVFIGYLVFRYLFWPALDDWRPQIEASLSRQLEASVTFGRLEPGRQGWRPHLVVHQLRVSVTGPEPEFAAAQVRASLSFRALLTGRLELARLELDDVRLVVERLEPRRWIVAGALLDLDRPGRRTQSWAWLLDTRHLAVRGLQVDWIDRLAGREQRFDELQLKALRSGARHQVALTVPQLAAAARELELRIDASLVSGGHPLELRHWRGEAHLSAQDIGFSALATELSSLLRSAPSAAIVQGGRGPVMLWSEFADGELRDLVVKARTDALDIAVGGRVLPLRSLSVDAQARRGLGSLIEIEIQQFSAADQAGLALTLDDRPQRIVLDAEGLRPVELALSSRGFDAAALLSAAQRLPLPADLSRPLAALRANGWIDSVGVSWRAGSGSADATYTVRLDFQRLGLRHAGAKPIPNPPGWPSFANLSGRVEFDERAGRVWLDSRQAVLTFPGVFAQPALSFSTLSGEFGWALEALPADAGVGASRPVQLRFDALQFANADLAGRLTGSYRLSGAALGTADLRGQINRINAARVARYLPLVVGPEVRNWVATAVRAGQSDDTQFVLRGDLNQFPFRDPAQGEFRVESRLAAAQLDFARGWPAIESIQGRMRFERAGLQIQVDRGRVSGVALADVSARIEDFARPLVLIQGRGEGRTPQMLEFLDRSPLRDQLDPALRQLQLQGDARLTLGLEVPLVAGQSTRYRGEVTLLDNRLELGAGLPPIDSLSTRLEFANDRISLRDLSARLLGGPVRGSAQWQGGTGLTIDSQGRAAALAVEQWLFGQGTGRWSGEGDYRLQVGVDAGGIRLRLESDLIGLASHLPAPLAKPVSEPRALRLDWRRPRAAAQPASTLGRVDAAGAASPTVEQLRAKIGADIELSLDRTADPSTGVYRVSRGVLALGRQADLPERGFTVAVRLPQIDLDQWLAALRTASAEAPGRSAATALAPHPPALFEAIDRVTLTVDAATLAGRVFERVVAAGSRQGELWRIGLRAAQADGQLEWRAANATASGGSMVGRFARLEIPAAPTASESAGQRPATEHSRLPALDIEAAQFVLSGRELGRLSLSAVNAGSPEDAFWRLDRLELVHPGGRLSASGRWRPPAVPAASAAVASAAGGVGTELDFRLSLADPARLLSTFGLQGALSGGAGRMSGRIAWRGSPLGLDYPTLSGLVDIELGRGQFLKTEPGIAKLIGVLNLQSLPRRLNLDFRDLIAEGFAFDEIRGVATLASGVARTEDFRMRGVQAQVEIRGEADLAAETQNLRIRVRPEMNAGLASLAYAAVANPAVGLGSFLAQLALRKPLQDIFSYEYDVTGSWVDPHVVERARPRIELPAP